MEYLEKCFEKLKKNNLSLRLDKCEFAQFEVEQFGLKITRNGIRPSLENVSKIKDYPRPHLYVGAILYLQSFNCSFFVTINLMK